MKCHSPPTQSPDPRSCRQGSCLWVGAALPAYLPFIPLHLISWSPMVQVAMSAVLPSSKRVPFSAMFRMTNYLQLISGYLELEDYTKALRKTKETIKELHALATSLTGLADGGMTVPEDGAVVVPHGSEW